MEIALLAAMIATASVAARRTDAFPRWLATGGLVFSPLLLISRLAFPFDSTALYALLELALLLLLARVLSVTVVIARRTHGTSAVAATA